MTDRLAIPLPQGSQDWAVVALWVLVAVAVGCAALAVVENVRIHALSQKHDELADYVDRETTHLHARIEGLLNAQARPQTAVLPTVVQIPETAAEHITDQAVAKMKQVIAQTSAMPAVPPHLLPRPPAKPPLITEVPEEIAGARTDPLPLVDVSELDVPTPDQQAEPTRPNFRKVPPPETALIPAFQAPGQQQAGRRGKHSADD